MGKILMRNQTYLLSMGWLDWLPLLGKPEVGFPEHSFPLAFYTVFVQFTRGLPSSPIISVVSVVVSVSSLLLIIYLFDFHVLFLSV